MKVILRKLLLGLGVVLVSVPIALAQGTTATIFGTVRDQTGAVLPGANIRVTGQETGRVREVVTDAGGRYRVPALELGTYEVQASLAGFRTSVRPGIVLTVGSEIVVDLAMEVGAVAESVTVTGEAPLVQTTNAQLSGLVGDKEIRDLPLNGRSYEQLALLQPGVIQFTNAGGGEVSTRVFNGAGSKIAVGGISTDSTSYLLDGTDVHDQAGFTPGSVAMNNLGVDSILEFRVLTQNYSAEYGRTAGGVITAVTRSGTNSLHGSLFEFLRNNALDARQFFDVGGTKPFRRNQFGASAGGPILRDRTFFFANYEGLRERLALTSISTVPDAVARQGILPGPSGPVNVGVASTVRPYLDLFPLPNGRNFGDGTAEFRWSLSAPTREDFGSVRIDHQFSDRNFFFGRLTLDDAEVVTPRTFPDFFLAGVSRNVFTTLEQKTILSSQTLNVFRVAFNRTNPTLNSDAYTTNIEALAYIPGRKWNFRFAPGAAGASAAVTEMGPLASQPVLLAQNIFQFTDDVHFQRGSHFMQAGVNIERIQNNSHENSSEGTYFFPDLAAFLRGLPNQFSGQTLDSVNQFGYRQTLAGFYFQDDLHVGSRLTFNLGLRYEFITVPTEVHGRRSNIRNVLVDSAVTIGAPTENPSLRNFAPRFGFAWTPTRDGKTAVRGGFGVYFNQFMGKLYTVISESGFSASVNLNNPPFPHPNLAVVVGNRSAFTTDPKIKTPTVYQFNLTVERQMLSGLVLTVGYAGNHGLHMIRKAEGNPVIPQFLPDGTPFYSGTRRYNPNFGSLDNLRTDAIANYHAMQLRVTKRFSQGLQLQGSYTLSKATSDGTAYRVVQTQNTTDQSLIPFNRHADRGLSSFDVRQVLAVNYTYHFPGESLKGWVATVGKGWEMNGIVKASSGFPFSVGIPFNQSGDGNVRAPDRPNLRPGRSNNPVLGKVERWYDPTAFELPLRGFYGNLGRNTVTGPGLATVDFSLVKNFSLFERHTLAFRSEFFNLFNHANFGLPNRFAFTSTGAIAGNAGVIQNLNTAARQIQFGLRYSF